MAVEKASLGHVVDALELSREALERALNRMEEAFSACPKSTIKRRLKKKAKDLSWPIDYNTLFQK